MSPELIATIERHTEDDITFFRAHGQLTEERMELSGIPTLDDIGGKPRDQRVLHQQRAVLLTNPETIQRRLTYIHSGLPVQEAVSTAISRVNLTREQQRELQAASKIVQGVLTREKSRAKEKERKAALSKEDLAAEKTAAKAKANLKKEAKKTLVDEAFKKIENVSGIHMR
jgi:hypothetical protein